MASTEIIDIVDKENNVVGTTDVNTAHNEKLMHRVAGVFVFSPDGHLYLQTGNKYGKLDLSVGGHVQKGESYEQAAQRETHEEIGLEVALTHVSTFLPKEARLNHFWAIFTANAPEGWVFTETEEVKSLEKISLDEIKQMMKSEPDLFTHGFMNTMQELIRIKNI
ncbi:MAG: NUDIX domain-containing protein [Desulfobacteraceae bacterium]|jgi:isopentenyldiphosphate isomerase|nr:NUDIX domain-containing protein [Desulfobacteraceae bacterium]